MTARGPGGAEIRPAIFPEDLEVARELLREYRRAVDAARCFESFERELAALPAIYGPPAGRLLLALDGGVPVGCAALRLVDRERGEARRLYVRASARGRGIGAALMARLAAEARAAGCRALVLETLPGKMDAALAMYRALGCREIPPYVARPTPGALYLELLLDGGSGGGPPAG